MDDPVIAAAKVIYAAGHRHGWRGFEKPYADLDAIGRSEFEGIVEEALGAADAARAGQPPSTRRPRKPGALRGKIWLAEDSERTSDDLIDAMEGKDTA